LPFAVGYLVAGRCRRLSLGQWRVESGEWRVDNKRRVAKSFSGADAPKNGGTMTHIARACSRATIKGNIFFVETETRVHYDNNDYLNHSKYI
jgi:hypothetical protein